MLNIQVFWDVYAMLIGKQSSFHCLIVKVRTIRTSETSRNTYRMIQCNIPADMRALYFLLFLLHYWPCHLFISNRTVLTLFYYQLRHITLKNAELLKHSKLDKNAPTCFGLYRNHLQGAKVSVWLKITRLVNSICVKDVPGVISAMAAYCDM